MSTRTPTTHFMTGCASGIGRHVADLLIARGDRVYATDANFEGLKKHAEAKGWPEDRVRTDTLDVRKLEAWEAVFARAVEAFGRVDVCMNIAGVMMSGWSYEQPAEEVELQIDINTKGVIWGTQVAARHMMQHHSGHIINIASIAGIAAVPGISVYSASKHAVRGFSLAAGFELRQYGIFVTVLSPDATNTPLLEQSSKHDAGAVVFSGPRLMTLEEVGQVMLNRVLTRKEVEVAIPLSRALLARLASQIPWMGDMLLPSLRKKGRVHQTEHRKEAGGSEDATQPD